MLQLIRTANGESLGLRVLPKINWRAARRAPPGKGGARAGARLYRNRSDITRAPRTGVGGTCLSQRGTKLETTTAARTVYEEGKKRQRQFFSATLSPYRRTGRIEGNQLHILARAFDLVLILADRTFPRAARLIHRHSDSSHTGDLTVASDERFSVGWIGTSAWAP